MESRAFIADSHLSLRRPISNAALPKQLTNLAGYRRLASGFTCRLIRHFTAREILRFRSFPLHEKVWKAIWQAMFKIYFSLYIRIITRFGQAKFTTSIASPCY